MKSFIAAISLSIAVCGCRDQAGKCKAAAASLPARYPVDSPEASAFIAACTQGEWTDQQIQCVLRTSQGTLGSSFCVEPR
jgi:hypothetical protein